MAIPPADIRILLLRVQIIILNFLNARVAVIDPEQS
jgi:hypothetical protein